MVNVSNLPAGLAEELAFSEDELHELQIARKNLLFLMRIVLKPLRKGL